MCMLGENNSSQSHQQSSVHPYMERRAKLVLQFVNSISDDIMYTTLYKLRFLPVENSHNYAGMLKCVPVMAYRWSQCFQLHPLDLWYSLTDLVE